MMVTTQGEARSHSPSSMQVTPLSRNGIFSRLYHVVLFCLLLFLPAFAQAQQNEAPALTGGVSNYTVQPGEYLERIGARYGIDALTIAKDNRISTPDLILPHRVLRLDNRHIVPGGVRDGIVINLPQRMLFFFREGRLAAAYPVGLGRPSWPTVQGTFRVSLLERNPTWEVPKSIQDEMAREGEIVRTKVPPGPDNPLGEYWIGLSAPGYGLHGTIAPESVYHFQSHGCIRLHPDDVAALFPQVARGMTVKIIYEPVLIAEQGGRVFIEVQPDVYHRAPPPLESIRRLAAARQLTDRIDWQQAQSLSRERSGVARDATAP